MAIERAGRSNAAGNASVSAERTTEERSVDPTHERKAAEAAAEKRRNDHYTANDCTKSPPIASRSSGSTSTHNAAENSATTAPAPADRRPADMAATATEVMRLRGEPATATDPQRSRAISARIGALSTQWCEMARAKGMTPPGESFDPSRATDAQLQSAVLWMEVGNAYPVSALQDGGARYRNDLLLTHAVRSPALLGKLVEATKDHPERLVPLLQRELHRLGDTRPCTANDTVDSLLGRRAEMLRLRDNGAAAQAAEEARKRITVGIDGRIGKTEDVVTYEMEQHILAANPGTTLGALLAASSDDIDGKRRAGNLGNVIEGMSSIGGRTKASDLPKVGRDAPIVRP